MDDELECLYCMTPLTKSDVDQSGDYYCEWCNTIYMYDSTFDQLEEFDEFSEGIDR